MTTIVVNCQPFIHWEFPHSDPGARSGKFPTHFPTLFSHFGHLFSHLWLPFFPLPEPFSHFCYFFPLYSFVFKAFLISDSQFCSFSPFGFQGGRAPGAGNERLALEWENKVGIFPLKWEKVSGSADRRSGKKVNRISHFSAEWENFRCMINPPPRI